MRQVTARGEERNEFDEIDRWRNADGGWVRGRSGCPSYNWDKVYWRSWAELVG